MAIYNKFPNLARQTENPINMSYYGGLSKPNPIGNSLGNQSISQLKPTNNQLKPQPTQTFGSDFQNKLGGNGFVYDPTTGFGTYNGQQLGNEGRRNPVIWGRVGQYLSPAGATYGTSSWDDFARRAAAAPEYWEPYTEYTGGDAGDSYTNYRLRPEVQQRLNGRVQVEQLGSGGYSELINPAAVEWDDEFGLLTSPDNIAGPDNGPDWLQPRNLAGLAAAFAGASMLGYVPGFEGVPGLAGAGAGTTPAHMSTMLEGYGGAGAGGAGAGGASLGTYGTMTAGLDGGGLALAPSTGVGAAAGVGTGAGAPTLMETLFGSGGVGSFLQSPAGIVAGALLNNQLTNRYNRDAQGAADRADPFGQYRQQFAQRLIDLYKDPSSIENTPGYQFRRDQGEQAIERQAAKRGYFRSPNMLFDLSKFNSGLAQQAYNQEIQNLMALSGANQSGGTAGQILAGSATRSNNMRASTLGDLLDAGGSIVDWIMEQV